MTKDSKSGRCKVVGYVTLNGQVQEFPRPVGVKHGRRLCEFYRRQELEALNRFKSGDFADIDLYLYPELQALAV